MKSISLKEIQDKLEELTSTIEQHSYEYKLVTLGKIIAYADVADTLTRTNENISE